MEHAFMRYASFTVGLFFRSFQLHTVSVPHWRWYMGLMIRFWQYMQIFKINMTLIARKMKIKLQFAIFFGCNFFDFRQIAVEENHFYLNFHFIDFILTAAFYLTRFYFCLLFHRCFCCCSCCCSILFA